MNRFDRLVLPATTTTLAVLAIFVVTVSDDALSNTVVTLVTLVACIATVASWSMWAWERLGAQFAALHGAVAAEATAREEADGNVLADIMLFSSRG